MIKAILFDLDGTLLPLDETKFMKLYFGGIGAKFAKHGYDPNQIIQAIIAGTEQMRSNDGSKTNEQAFWPVFFQRIQGDSNWFYDQFVDFYETGFDQVSESTSPSEVPSQIMKILDHKRIRKALATNPLFPKIATHKRIGWAGLQVSDFEWISTYEVSKYSKPSLNYYQCFLDKMGLKAEECAMVGNDADEDMAARELGMHVFLLTDCLNNHQGKDIQVYPHGTMNELYEWIESLPEVIE
ncbi:MAG: HAD family hydrolase [Candidatus Izemoplasmatales bacterium]|nr:HAD family hydrolase [Candidatus Izemoplasmatales bacterium]